jgi:hypothetical protein
MANPIPISGHATFRLEPGRRARCRKARDVDAEVVVANGIRRRGRGRRALERHRALAGVEHREPLRLPGCGRPIAEVRRDVDGNLLLACTARARERRSCERERGAEHDGGNE